MEFKESLYKIIVIGDLGTGKTSIIRRSVHNTYDTNYRSTIGVDFAAKTVCDGDRIIRLQFWDIAGQERFGNMTRVYYKDADAAIIVFDLSRDSTLLGAAKWKRDLDSKLLDIEDLPVILVGNKCDLFLSSPEINDTSIKNFCKENGMNIWFKTSAKNDIGIDDLMDHITKIFMDKDLSNYPNPKQQNESIITLSSQSKPTSKSCC